MYRFATGIAFPDIPHAWWWRLAKSLGREKLLLKRVIPGLPKGKLHLQPIKETIALFRHQKLGQANDEVFYPRNKAFQQQIPQRLIDGSDAVIGFDTSSWILAERCRKTGKPFVLDASIAHPLAKEKTFSMLREQYPVWTAELAPKKPQLIEAELREIELASHIVVASSFTKQTYTDHGVSEGKISINPYGTDLEIPKEQIPNTSGEIPVIQIPNSMPEGSSSLEFGISKFGISGITFLFFGSLSARKGFPLLCEVWETFYQRYPNCRLLAAGYDNRPKGFRVPQGVEVLGSIHPNDRAALFASADVFVFPSFFEGFGQVILEAMACGLPVITTTATAGPDLLGALGGGIIFEPGNRTGLLQAMEFYAKNPGQTALSGQQASASASTFSWQAYGERWVKILEKVIA